MLSTKHSMCFHSIRFFIFTLLVQTSYISTCSFSNNYKRILAISHFLPVLIQGASLIKEKLEPVSEIDQQVKDFVIEQCKNVNVEHPEKINIKVGGDPRNFYLAGTNSIYITEPNYNELKKHLELKAQHKLDKTTDSEQYAQIVSGLNIHAALIQHEANHIKNQDVLYQFLLTLTTTFGVEAVYQALCYLLEDNAFTDPAQKSWGHTIAQNLIKTCIITTIRIFYMRHYEQRADDGIQDNKDILHAAKSFFARLHEQLRNHINTTNGPEALAMHDAHPWLFGVFDFAHPSHITRVQKLEKRLAALS